MQLSSLREVILTCINFSLRSLRRATVVLKLFVVITCTAVTVWQCYNVSISCIFLFQ